MTYPDDIDVFSTKANNEIIDADNINDLQNALVAVETELGTNPKGSYADVAERLAALAPLASPALTGNPTAPTASLNDNDTSIATTAFVMQQLLDLLKYSNWETFKDFVALYPTTCYDLYDKFTTPLSAGAVNGTAAEPVGGTRTVTDTNSKVSIVGGKISVSSGGVSSEYVVAYPSISRGLGKVFLFDLNHSTGSYQAGFATSQAVNTGDGSFRFTTISQVRYQGTIISVHDSVLQKYAIVLRASGTFYFGYTSNWILLYALTSGNSATLIPSFINGTTTQVFTADNIRVPKRLYIPIPLQSDGFSSTTTDGQGNAENNGPIRNTWTDAVGTWGVAAGVASASALSGGNAIRTIACISADVIADVEVTRSAGNAGLVVRYQDASNYIGAIHNGTNVLLFKVVAGVTTILINAAAPYVAGAVLRVITDGTAIRVFYNNAAVGTVQTVTEFSTTATHGLFTNDTGNTFDDFCVWARGTGGEYGELNYL